MQVPNLEKSVNKSRGNTGEVTVTRVVKKNKTGREKLSPDVTAALQPQRVNLGLTYHSYSHHMHTQSSELQQSSGDNIFL